MGSRKSHQEQVKSLIRDAILLLCQHGLEGSTPSTVEALVGITMADGDVMLISINEVFDGMNDISGAPLGAALSKILPSFGFEADDIDIEPNWPGKRKLASKPKLFKSKRKRGRPRKIANAFIKTEDSNQPAHEAEPGTSAVAAEPSDDAVDDAMETGEYVPANNFMENTEPTDLDGEPKAPDDRCDPGTSGSSHAIVKGQGAEAALGGDADIPQVGPYQCAMCPSVYKYRKCLIEHQIKIHAPKDPEVEAENVAYPCETCDKTFSSKRSLTRHVVVHSVDREKYPCNICNKRFSCLRHVDFHVKTVHEGLYPYMCEICGKHVTSKSSLSGHMASKHAVDRIKCNKCDREYATHTTFLKHACVERPPKMEETSCDICNKEFGTPKRLVQHMSKHMEPRHQCATCGRTFKWASSLQAHKLAAHKEGLQPKNQLQELPGMLHEGRDQSANGSQEHVILERIGLQQGERLGERLEGHGHVEPQMEIRLDSSQSQIESTVDASSLDNTPSSSYGSHPETLRTAQLYYTPSYVQTATATGEIIVPATWQGDAPATFYGGLPNQP